MSDIAKEAWLNERVSHRRKGRRFVTDERMRWGELILPAEGEAAGKTAAGLPLLAIGCYPMGNLVVRTLLAYERAFPDRLNILAVLTDDPVNPDARVSARKRIWHYFSPEEQREIEFGIVESALEAGVPVFTGDVKNDWFRAYLNELAPQAAICCCFGQVIDRPILSAVPMGIYNMHPSDLAAGHGAGPAPYDDAVACDLATTRFTVHLMSEGIDDEPIIAPSPPINIRSAAGEIPGDPLLYYDRMLEGLDYLAVQLVEALIDAAAAGRREPLAPLDLAARVPAEIRARMMLPLGERKVERWTEPDPALFGG